MEILDGRVIRLWKTEKGKIINLHLNSAYVNMRLWSCMRDCGRTSCTLIYRISILQAGKLTKQRYFLSQILYVERRVLCNFFIQTLVECPVN